MDKEDVVYLYHRILLTIKRSKIITFVATWIDLEIIIVSEVSQIEKHGYHTILLIFGIKI